MCLPRFSVSLSLASFASWSLSLLVSVSFSVWILLSHASPRPPLLQRTSLSWLRTPTQSFQELPGQAQFPHPQTSSHGPERGLSLAAATFPRTIPFASAAAASTDRLQMG